MKLCKDSMFGFVEAVPFLRSDEYRVASFVKRYELSKWCIVNNLLSFTALTQLLHLFVRRNYTSLIQGKSGGLCFLFGPLAYVNHSCKARQAITVSESSAFTDGLSNVWNAGIRVRAVARIASYKGAPKPALKAGEELLVNYGKEYFEDESHAAFFSCKCNARDCVGKASK